MKLEWVTGRDEGLLRISEDGRLQFEHRYDLNREEKVTMYRDEDGVELERPVTIYLRALKAAVAHGFSASAFLPRGVGRRPDNAEAGL